MLFVISSVLVFAVRGVSFDVDGAERACRAEVLAGSATDATFCVDGWNLGRFGVVGIGSNHLNGSRGTVAGTVAAADAIGQGHAIFLYPDGMTYSGGRFLLYADGTDGSCGAHFGTTGALRAAISALVGHFWLHQRGQFGRWSQHIVGASRHTQLACRAMMGKLSGTPCAWGDNGRSPTGPLFVDNDGQSAIHFFLLSVDKTCCCHRCGSYQEGATGCVGLQSGRFRAFGGFRAACFFS